VSLFTGPSAPADPAQHHLKVAADEGFLGGPSYRYRCATIDCQKGGRVCRLTLDGHPLVSQTFGVAGTITPLVNLWLEEGRLPKSMRRLPEAVRDIARKARLSGAPATGRLRRAANNSLSRSRPWHANWRASSGQSGGRSSRCSPPPVSTYSP